MRGQALVEFAAVLLPMLLLIVGVIQFGLLFGANVTMTNAAREAARAATIYVYDNSHTKTWNDAERCGDDHRAQWAGSLRAEPGRYRQPRQPASCRCS